MNHKIQEIIRGAAERIYRIANFAPEDRESTLAELDKPGVMETEDAILRSVQEVIGEAGVEGALEPISDLADAFDADVRHRGYTLPNTHEGDDCAVAFPVDTITRFIRPRPPFGKYLTMRDACTARAALRTIKELQGEAR